MKNINGPVHFIGIGGSGMSPIAAFLHECNIEVQGSDLGKSHIIESMKDSGITIFTDHKDENIKNAKTIVFSTAIKGDNPELLKAKELNIEILHRSDILNLISKNYKTIFVAGSHGKTSTTGMVAHVLHAAGLSPSVIAGGVMLNTGTSFLKGEGEYLVAEADESDGSFLKYIPHAAIITNIDYDHLDFYGDFEGLKEAFREFGSQTEEDGFRVYNWDNDPIREIARDTGDFIGYGSVIGCHNRLIDSNFSKNKTLLKVIVGHQIQEYDLPIIGKHNIENALAAITLASEMEIDYRAIRDALATFRGMEKRLEKKYEDKNFTVFSDYSHNPGKISSAINAVRTSFVDSNIIIVFEPHRYSRLTTMYDKFCEAFKMADQVIVTPIYSAGEKSVENINHTKLAKDISHLSHIITTPIAHLNEIYQSLNVKHSAHNVILMVGAGDIAKACDPLLEQINCSVDS